MSSPNAQPTRHDPERKVDPGHGLIMILCCVPMLVIALVLLTRGDVLAALVLALVCVAMTAGMRAMDE
jgi:hypothetical protein